MSIESKHAYRFVYLKSDQWQNVRLEALAREKAKCEICYAESISNDAHHIWYPENIWETTSDHLVILCRPCHDFIHTMLPECKTKDEELGRQEWLRFKNAIIIWRRDKLQLFENAEGIKIPNPRQLREELAKLKTTIASGTDKAYKERVGKLLTHIKKLIDDHLESA